MNVLVLGAGGMLGQDLLATAPSDLTVVPRTRAELDVTDQDSLATAIDTVRPRVVVNAAAYTAVDRAEVERDAAFKVNADAVGSLGRIAVQRGCKIVHISTDYVFDGAAERPYREDDAPAPVSAYGTSKLLGEQALKESGAEYLIVRTQWLFGTHGRSFPRTILERARAGSQTKVVNDQIGRPTYSTDLADAIWRSLRTSTGVLHITNSGEPVTWFSVAQRVFAHTGRSHLLSPCTSAEYPTPAKRPRYSVLDTGRFEALLGSLPNWTSGIERFLAVFDNQGTRSRA